MPSVSIPVYAPEAPNLSDPAYLQRKTEEALAKAPDRLGVVRVEATIDGQVEARLAIRTAGANGRPQWEVGAVIARRPARRIDAGGYLEWRWGRR